MKILFDFNHPADIHFFRHTIEQLRASGHQVIITARDKDVVIRLLDSYGWPYTKISTAGKGLLAMGWELLTRNLKMLRIYLRDKVDVGVAFTGASVAQVGWLTRVPSLVFYDNEEAKLQNKITYPFATRIYTPSCYLDDLGPRHTRFNGIKEMAYMDLRYFKPDPQVLRELGVAEDERFAVIRTVAWQAAHDIGASGLSVSTLRRLVDELEKTGKVFLIAEGQLPDEFARNLIPVSPDRIHHVLYYAGLFVGEGATMACECACVGTPAVYINSLMPSHVTEVVEAGLVLRLSDADQIVRQSAAIFAQTDRSEWREKAEQFLEQRIDVSQWVTDEVTRFGSRLS